MSPDVQILGHDLKRQDKVYSLTRCPERACVPMLRTARGLLILFISTAVALPVFARHVRQSDAHARRLSGAVASMIGHTAVGRARRAGRATW